MAARKHLNGLKCNFYCCYCHGKNKNPVCTQLATFVSFSPLTRKSKTKSEKRVKKRDEENELNKKNECDMELQLV